MVRILLVSSVIALVACNKKPVADVRSDPPSTPPAPSTPASDQLSAHGWTLVQLGDRPNPLGAGDKAPDLAFDATASRASGFAGCNRFSGGYAVAADSLHFGALMSTKMACPGKDQVEVGYLAALNAVVTYTIADGALILFGPGGTKLAEFHGEK